MPTGYFFCPLQERLADLTELDRVHGIAAVPEIQLAPTAGEAILFQPSRVLHKGIRPTWGRRRMFSLGIIPCPGGWRKAFPVFESTLIQNTGFDFPPLGLG